jgi:hypothetical protein
VEDTPVTPNTIPVSDTAVPKEAVAETPETSTAIGLFQAPSPQVPLPHPVILVNIYSIRLFV